MTPAVAEFFDGVAPKYDALWTGTDVGRLQRDAVWRHIDPLARAGSRVLDLGCGTGEDALHFAGRGACVEAIDISPEMVRVAQAKGVNARHLPLEQLAEERPSEITGYDLVMSNFGAMNCIADLSPVSESLARLVRPRGSLAICVMNRFCLRETVHFAIRGRFSESKRRWSGQTRTSSGWMVFYPSKNTICQSLTPHFRLQIDVGVGLFVPPSYVQRTPQRLLRVLASLDRFIEGLPLLRSIGDHRLLIFSRV